MIIASLRSFISLPYHDHLLSPYRKYREIWKSPSSSRRKFPKAKSPFSHWGGQHALWEWSGQALLWRELPGDWWSQTCPGTGTGRWWQGEEQNCLCSVYLNYIPFIELIEHKVSFLLPWNLKALACPLHRSAVFKKVTYFGGSLEPRRTFPHGVPTAPSVPADCKHHVRSSLLRTGERTHVSHRK